MASIFTEWWPQITDQAMLHVFDNSPVFDLELALLCSDA
jgi:hypothetical protein